MQKIRNFFDVKSTELKVAIKIDLEQWSIYFLLLHIKLPHFYMRVLDVKLLSTHEQNQHFLYLFIQALCDGDILLKRNQNEFIQIYLLCDITISFQCIDATRNHISVSFLKYKINQNTKKTNFFLFTQNTLPIKHNKYTYV